MTNFYELQKNQIEAGTNPVQKIPLMVTGDDAKVFIELLVDNDGGGGGGGFSVNQLTEVTGVGRGTTDRRSNMMGTHELHYMNSILVHLREDKKAIRDEMARFHEQEKRMWKMMNENLKASMRHPTLMHGILAPEQRREGGEGSDESEMYIRENDYSENSWIFQDNESLLTLNRNPNSIYELWDEYEFRIGDRKAAKAFTNKEVCDKVTEIVRSGWNTAAACHLIYTVYGQPSSVATIINQTRKDKRSGDNPAPQRLKVNNL